MTADTILASLSLSAPEVILALGALVLLMIGVFSGEKSAARVSLLAALLMAVACFWLIFVTGSGEAYGGVFSADPFAKFMKVLALIGSIVALLMTAGQARESGIDKFEFPVLVVLSTLGMMLMISANDLISLYLSLELQSLALYVVAAINRDSLKSTEAGLKYFVLGALSSGMLLYGMSLVYGFTGHTGFDEIATALSASDRSLGLVFGLVFVLAGIAFKISAVPFHMWTPDVYEGAPTPVTAFFAAAPKVAAMAMMVRIVIIAFEPVLHDWQQVVVFISIASMLLGSFAAIGQTNIKRLMAYSSIGHMGYALVGLAAGSAGGVSGVILYMTIYMVMTLGTFACIMSMRRKEGQMVETVEDLAGLSQTNPFMATVLTALMFSLAGIPPLAGFFAKYFVFVAAVEAKLYALAIIGVLASVVGAYYYLRVIKLMWFDDAKGDFARSPGMLRLVYGLSGLFVLAYVVIGGPIGTAAEVAARTFFLTGADGRRRRLVDDVRHVALDETDSTNSACFARARAGDPGLLWITASRQTGGRGRRGRPWVSECGNLYASLLLVEPAPLDCLHSLPLAVAIAVHRAIKSVMPPGGRSVAVKWPNDILIGGAKTCGILLEGESLPGGHHALVIGCGINIAHAPDHGMYAVTSLQAEGSPASPEELFAHLFVTMAEALDVWDRGNGIAAIIAEWRAVAAGIGERITVNLPDRSIAGRFTGIDQDGRLILDPDHGAPMHIAAGDVFFG